MCALPTQAVGALWVDGGAGEEERRCACATHSKLWGGVGWMMGGETECSTPPHSVCWECAVHGAETGPLAVHPAMCCDYHSAVRLPQCTNVLQLPPEVSNVLQIPQRSAATTVHRPHLNFFWNTLKPCWSWKGSPQ